MDIFRVLLVTTLLLALPCVLGENRWVSSLSETSGFSEDELETPPTMDEMKPPSTKEDEEQIEVKDADKDQQRPKRVPTLYPITARKIIAFIIAALFLAIAAGGGIGGGGILVPMYAIVLEIELHFAIPLSNMTICFCALVNFMANIFARHPKADRPLIDWDLILIMEPLTIAGALTGSLINILMPAWATTILLVIVLSFTAYRSIQKGVQVYKKETKELIRLEAETHQPLNREDDAVVVESESAVDPREVNRREELAYLLKRESQFPWFKALILVFIMGTILFMELARAKDNKFNIDCDSVAYWIVTFAVFPFTIAILLLQRKFLIADYHNKKAIDYQYVAGDVRWDESATIKYPSVCALAGLFAGMFGIGGGIVKGPLMIEMGVQPTVAAACSATMVLFTAASAGVSFALYGVVPLEYACVMGPVGVVSTALGLTLMKKLIHKTGHPSYIILCIGIVVALSGLMMGIYGIIEYSKPGALASTLTVHQKLCAH